MQRTAFLCTGCQTSRTHCSTWGRCRVQNGQGRQTVRSLTQRRSSLHRHVESDRILKTTVLTVLTVLVALEVPVFECACNSSVEVCVQEIRVLTVLRCTVLRCNTARICHSSFIGTAGSGDVSANTTLGSHDGRRIGIAIAESLNGPWRRQNGPLFGPEASNVSLLYVLCCGGVGSYSQLS